VHSAVFYLLYYGLGVYVLLIFFFYVNRIFENKEEIISRLCLNIIILPRILLYSELFIIIMNIGRKNWFVPTPDTIYS